MALCLVVTGASGFLGAAVVRAANAAGVHVVPVARTALSGGVRVDDYSATPCGDVLIHLAENNDRAQAARAGADYARMACHTAERLIAKGFRRIVYASSAALYGKDSAAPCTPSATVYTEDVYALTKRRIEEAMLDTGTAVIARIANVYGPGMSEANVVSAILRQIPGEGPLRVIDARPVRDFIWVEDAARAILAMATQGGVPGVYNVGSGTGSSVERVARLALEAAGEAHRHVCSSRPSACPSRLVLDVSATERQWRWHPSVQLDVGLARLVAGRTERSLQ